MAFEILAQYQKVKVESARCIKAALRAEVGHAECVVVATGVAASVPVAFVADRGSRLHPVLLSLISLLS